MRLIQSFLVLASSFLSLFSQSAEAITLAQLCNRFSEGSTISKCFAAADGQDCDEKALDLCSRFSELASIVGCVEAVAGREYTDEEVAVCDRFSEVASIANCLRSAGRRVSSSHSRGDTKEIVRILRDIIDGNERSAELKIRQLERKFDISK